MTNVEVVVTDPSADGIAKALRIFKKAYISHVSADVKRHAYYLKPGERKRVKAKRARKRARKQTQYWTAERIAYLDKHGLSDNDKGRAPIRRGGLSAAPGADLASVAGASATSKPGDQAEEREARRGTEEPERIADSNSSTLLTQ